MTTVCSQWQQGALSVTTPSCGPKHDNLVQARAVVPREVASFPPFFGFTDAQIKAVLSARTKALWEEVCACESMEKLPELQRSVEDDILAANLPLTALQRRMLSGFSGKILIVRSSSNEDTDVVNAGGNETIANVAPTEEGVKQALAKVVASYFGRRSLNNRSAFGNPFKAMPDCSAMVMVQIVGKDVVSGVMITHKAAWFRQREGRVPHIVASKGFGGGIVSGEKPSDEWVLEYSMIRRKPNAPELPETPCLTGAQIKRLERAGRYLEEFFRKPQDVEFVFQGGELYIVQTRESKAPEMTNPTFLDPTTIPATAGCFQSTSLIPGMSQVLTLFRSNVLFARDLNHAEDEYRPGSHKAVVIYTPPASGNTHAEMNFASQRPHPIPCFVLPHEAWEMCEKRSGEDWNTLLYLCPQTGFLVTTTGDLPVRTGLFLHPARFSISVPGIQSAVSANPRIERLRAILTATPTQLSSNLTEVQGELTHLFTEISHRTAAQTSRLQQVTHQLHEIAMNVFQKMQEAAKKNQPTLLSFHAGILRQLAQQSISGLEVATDLPASIELFLKTHQDPVLCELALLAKKAWDEPIREKWLAFIQKNGGEALLTQLRELDTLGMLPVWFAIHFSGEETPSMEALMHQDKEFLGHCLKFTHQWHQLTERMERIDTVAELMATCETLLIQTDAFLAFCSQFPKRDFLQSLQLSRASYNLIQLWDAQIKIVKTSKLLPEVETNDMFKRCVDLFAQFGLLAIQHRAIAIDNMTHRGELQKVLEECGTLPRPRSSDRKFSVQHWIVPRSRVYMPISNDEERFTIIHQNLLRASAFDFTPDHLRLLPLVLANAVRTFQECMTTKAKRFGGDRGTFVSILEESASVTINIPLNFHSFVLTIQQNKGSNAVEFNAYWKGNDNSQVGHLEFIQLFSSIANFTVKSYLMTGPDLQVVLSAETREQIDSVSRMIDHINDMSLHAKDYFEALVRLLHPRGIQGKTMEKCFEETKDTRTRVKAIIWKQLSDTGTVPDFAKNSQMTHQFDREYLEENGHWKGVVPHFPEKLYLGFPRKLYI